MEGKLAAHPGQGIPAAADSGPWTWRQKLLLLIVGMAILLDGFDNQALGLAAPAILRDWNIPKEALAQTLALGQVGMMAGTAFGGLLGDRIGRKAALISAVATFGLATFLMAWAINVPMLSVLASWPA